jgi:hypothetical protein
MCIWKSRRYAERRRRTKNILRRKIMTKTKQDTMHAAALDRFGGIETITLQTLPMPEVGPDEVLIRVESAGVASWDAVERERNTTGLSD